MLIGFEVENFKSFAHRAQLSMVAIDEDRPDTRHQESIGHDLLTTAGVFGPNASGKSNLLEALAWVVIAVRDSLSRWDSGIPIPAFSFGNGPAETSEFAVDMIVNGVRFEYQLEVDASHVATESLSYYPVGRRRRIFERIGNSLTLSRGQGELAGARALLTDHTLALSVMRRFADTGAGEFGAALLNSGIVGNITRGRRWLPFGPFTSTMNLFHRDSGDQPDLFTDALSSATAPQNDRDRALALLRMADLGVIDVEIIETTEETLSGRPITRHIPQLVHTSKATRQAFDFGAESAGTQTWFSLIGPILSALRSGSMLIFDELDAGLHPVLTMQLITMFHDPETNPRGAQLIFSSHDTNLLNALGRDEIWLTEKDESGATHFGSLAEFAGERVRRSSNIESGYLAGRFGALPNLDFTVLHELGLT